MGIAICAKRCCWAIYFKKGWPLIHSCHHCLERSCHRGEACPTSLLRSNLLITDYCGFTRSLCYWVSQWFWFAAVFAKHQQNHPSALPACGHISLPQTDCLGLVFPEHFLPSIVGVLFIFSSWVSLLEVLLALRTSWSTISPHLLVLRSTCSSTWWYHFRKPILYLWNRKSHSGRPRGG